jgi:hypothetical protein
MLTIDVPDIELFNNDTSEYIYLKAITLKFENSLVSISKWESKWHKPFPAYQAKNVAKANKIEFTNEDFIDYIQCMCLTQNVDPLIFQNLPFECLNEIKKYIEDPMTATTFSKRDDKPSRKIVTSELVYFWMASNQIPFEAAKWHINRLLTLINICSVENAPKQKKSKGQVANEYRALNAARRKPKK